MSALTPNLTRAYLSLKKTSDDLALSVAYAASTALPGSCDYYDRAYRDAVALEYRALRLEMDQLNREGSAMARAAA